MSTQDKSKREHWSGKFGFILAAVGSAVGLGNLWKFPYITWQNGGGLFVLIYLLCILLIGLPIMISEIILGKLSGKGQFSTFKKLEKIKSPYSIFGFLGVITSFVLLSYYSVIAGWSIEYQIKSYQNEFGKINIENIYKILSKDHLEKKASVKDTKREEVKVFGEDIDKIHQIISHSETKITSMIKKKAFLEAVAQPLPEVIYKKLSKDIPSFKDYDKLSSSEINLILSEHLNSKKKNDRNNIFKWYNYFYNQKRASPKYQDWLQKTFLPLYSSSKFDEFINNREKMLLWHSVIMLIICLIALGGVKNGIEQVSKYGVSILFIILLILMVNSLFLDKQNQSLWFLIKGDSTKFTFDSIIEALGHAFFTLSIGLGVMVTYGSYLKKKENPINNAIIITLADTSISFIACLVIFPIIFVQGMNPTSGGIGILFTTLPLEFYKFAGGRYLSLLFYILILIAALTSAISLLEVVINYCKDQLRMKRASAVIISGILIYIAGIPSAMSLGFLGAADSIVSNILLPLGGLTVATFVGYRMDINLIKNEFIKNGYSLKVFYWFKFSIRYVSPALLTFILINLVKKILG